MTKMHHLMHTYNPLPVSFTHGEGVYLYDAKQQQYLDAMCGIAVTNLGHNHPEVTQAIQTQANKLLHTSNVFQIQAQIDLGDALCKATQMDKVYFANSGAEANEAAIKLARLYGVKRKIKQSKIIVMENSFHGRTMACISASSGKKYQQGFEPLLAGFLHIKYNDIAALEQVLSQDKAISAVMLEPIQGEAGVNLPDCNYLKQVRALCDTHNCLMILDEVQTGMGRTGSLFHFLQHDIKPDILTSAKALANGIPIGACLAQGETAELFTPGTHGSTFGGNPFACTVALATLNTINQADLLTNVNKVGKQLLSELQTALSNISGVKQVRGCGLMIGIELEKPCRPLLKIALEQGLLLSTARDYTIRLLPPLILEPKHVQKIVQVLSEIIPQFLLANN